MGYDIKNVRNNWEIREPDSFYKVELLDRTFDFSILVLSQLNDFPNTKEADAIRYQIAKSSTSVGANYEEAQGASSKRDFYNKIKIVYRELRETNYWLWIIGRMEWIDKNSISPVFNESVELLKIFGKIRQTLRSQVEK